MFVINLNAEIVASMLSFWKSCHKPNLESTSKYGFSPDWREKMASFWACACKLSWTLLSPARVEPLYGTGRKQSSGTGLVLYVHALICALMTQKSCPVEMRNATLGNHLKCGCVSHERKKSTQQPCWNYKCPNSFPACLTTYIVTQGMSRHYVTLNNTHAWIGALRDWMCVLIQTSGIQCPVRPGSVAIGDEGDIVVTASQRGGEGTQPLTGATKGKWPPTFFLFHCRT